MEQVLVIPTFEPNEDVYPFLASLSDSPFIRIIVIDDGSGEKYRSVFTKIAQLEKFTLLSYDLNHGKGYALKYGIKYVVDNMPEVEGIITADSDGQHSKDDILKVAHTLKNNSNSLILGVRSFNEENVPKQNRFGNKFSIAYFHLITGVKLRDTQTGLRGITAALFKTALCAKGDRYDYEMNFLLNAVRVCPVEEIGISTIYEVKAKSHFHKFKDSVRIYKMLILYIIVALTSAGIDLSLFSLFTYIGPKDSILYTILFATVTARLISGIYNFLMNYFLVYQNKGQILKRILKYALVFVINMAASFGLTYLFNNLPASLVFIKFVVDFALFVLNFLISTTWIFASKMVKRHKRGNEI